MRPAPLAQALPKFAVCADELEYRADAAALHGRQLEHLADRIQELVLQVHIKHFVIAALRALHDQLLNERHVVRRCGPLEGIEPGRLAALELAVASAHGADHDLPAAVLVEE